MYAAHSQTPLLWATPPIRLLVSLNVSEEEEDVYGCLPACLPGRQKHTYEEGHIFILYKNNSFPPLSLARNTPASTYRIQGIIINKLIEKMCPWGNAKKTGIFICLTCVEI